VSAKSGRLGEEKLPAAHGVRAPHVDLALPTDPVAYACPAARSSMAEHRRTGRMAAILRVTAIKHGPQVGERAAKLHEQIDGVFVEADGTFRVLPNGLGDRGTSGDCVACANEPVQFPPKRLFGWVHRLSGLIGL
jgi:hypothetical protein